MREWFKNLKKWQKGGLIGCAVGLFFVSLILLIFTVAWYLDSWKVKNVGEWIAGFNIGAFVISEIIMDIIDRIKDTHVNIGYIWNPTVPFVCVGLVAMVVCYGGFGAVVGRAQQVNNPRIRWLLTGILAIFLLLIYWFNFWVAMFVKYA